MLKENNFFSTRTYHGWYRVNRDLQFLNCPCKSKKFFLAKKCQEIYCMSKNVSNYRFSVKNIEYTILAFFYKWPIVFHLEDSKIIFAPKKVQNSFFCQKLHPPYKLQLEIMKRKNFFFSYFNPLSSIVAYLLRKDWHAINQLLWNRLPNALNPFTGRA